MVSHPGQVLDPAAPGKDDRMLLKVMPLTRDIAGYLVTGREPDLTHLTQGRVRLFRCGGIDPGTDPALLRVALQGWSLGLLMRFLSRSAYELINRRHITILLKH